MDVPLLTDKKLQTTKRVTWWDSFVPELKRVTYIAVPLAVATISQYLLRFVAMMMVGHLSELQLSGTSIATSLTNVTGFSVLFGMSSALETLCGQAYGAGVYQNLGTYTYAGMISLVLTCLPISLLWIFMEKLLILMGQDPLISSEAGRYAVWLIPTLFPYAILQSLLRYLQSQSKIFPMLISSTAALIFHVPVCWALVFYCELGNAGAALSIGLSYWINVIFIFLYVKYSKSFEKTRMYFTPDVYLSIGDFFKLAIPSAVMTCLQWWTYEIVILLSGLLPNPQLETSVQSICLQIVTLHYFIPYALGGAASTRVSNELGAGNTGEAQVTVLAATTISVVECIIASAALFECRNVLGYAFSNEIEVVNYLSKMSPLICLMVIMDGIQRVLSGVARGCGWQQLGAYVNLAAYYLAGIPLAVVLGFVLHLKGIGLWVGLNVGSVVQTLIYGLITCLINWENQVVAARARVLGAAASLDEDANGDCC